MLNCLMFKGFSRFGYSFQRNIISGSAQESIHKNILSFLQLDYPFPTNMIWRSRI